MGNQQGLVASLEGAVTRPMSPFGADIETTIFPVHCFLHAPMISSHTLYTNCMLSNRYFKNLLYFFRSPEGIPQPAPVAGLESILNEGKADANKKAALPAHCSLSRGMYHFKNVAICECGVLSGFDLSRWE